MHILLIDYQLKALIFTSEQKHQQPQHTHTHLCTVITALPLVDRLDGGLCQKTHVDDPGVAGAQHEHLEPGGVEAGSNACCGVSQIFMICNSDARLRRHSPLEGFKLCIHRMHAVR